MNKYREIIISIKDNQSIDFLENILINNDIHYALVNNDNNILLYCYNIEEKYIIYLLKKNKIYFSIEKNSIINENDYLNQDYIKKYIETEKYNIHINKIFPIENTKKNIYINQKYSFGNGSHITTKLMIKNIEKYDFNDKSILDIGTGTGILSIISHFQNAQISIGIDVDEKSIFAMNENKKLNTCENIFYIISDIYTIKQTFDIIFINMLFTQMNSFLLSVKKLMKKNSLIFLSGIYENSNKDFLNLIQDYYKIKRSEKSENWYFYLLELL